MDVFAELLIADGCSIVGIFCRKLHLLYVGLDTIPSVLNEHKPLQVVRYV